MNGYKEHVDTRLIVRQRIFIVISIILLGVNIFNIAVGKLSVTLSASAFLLTVFMGIIFSRMFKIFYHEEKKKIMSQLDTVGIVFLILYILLEVSRKWIFEHWLSGEALNAFGLLILTGLLLGRFLATHLRIRKILHEKDSI